MRLDGSPRIFPAPVETWLAEFDGIAASLWVTQHDWIPVVAILLYLVLIFYGPRFMKKRAPLKARWPVWLWNLFLAVYSWCGVIRAGPYFFEKIFEAPFPEKFICTSAIAPGAHYYHGDLGFWTMAFMMSKIPEMFDTVLLVLKKREVIFLHWYHHITVMLYCWFIARTAFGGGQIFIIMNYSVHAIMYSYYFFMTFSSSTRRMVKPFAIGITLLQICQMVIGILVLAFARSYFADGKHIASDTNKTPCFLPMDYVNYGLVMYGSYFLLFSKLFVENYVLGRKDKSE